MGQFFIYFNPIGLCHEFFLLKIFFGSSPFDSNFEEVGSTLLFAIIKIGQLKVTINAKTNIVLVHPCFYIT